MVAAQRGCATVSFELNPFLAFVAKTKLIQGASAELAGGLRFVLSNSQHGGSSPLRGMSTFTERHEAEKWLSNLDILDTFEACIHSLDELKG